MAARPATDPSAYPANSCDSVARSGRNSFRLPCGVRCGLVVARRWSARADPNRSSDVAGSSSSLASPSFHRPRFIAERRMALDGRSTSAIFLAIPASGGLPGAAAGDSPHIRRSVFSCSGNAGLVRLQQNARPDHVSSRTLRTHEAPHGATRADVFSLARRPKPALEPRLPRCATGIAASGYFDVTTLNPRRGNTDVRLCVCKSGASEHRPRRQWATGGRSRIEGAGEFRRRDGGRSRCLERSPAPS